MFTAVWMIDVALCAFACVMSLKIREKRRKISVSYGKDCI
jgi:hypothetical protein